MPVREARGRKTQVAALTAVALLAGGWVTMAGSPSRAATIRDGRAAVVHGGVLAHKPQLAQQTIVADDGFRPQADGFGFENYGNKLHGGGVPDNLTAAQMRALFGDSVCADRSSGKCDLTPEATAWMDQTNPEPVKLSETSGCLSGLR